VGWCQFGAPDEVPKVKNDGALSAYERPGFERDREIGKHGGS
jgi:hypothetical protein